MQPKKTNDCYCLRKLGRVAQGDIIKKLDITISSKLSETNEFSLAPSFSFGVILSQECDLEQHYKLLEKNIANEVENHTFDKIVETILICPAFPIEQFLAGTHIAGKPMFDFDGPKGQRKAYDKLKLNDVYSRFHYLPEYDDKLPELVIDFKRFYTIPIEVVEHSYKQILVAGIKELYRERLSQRFSNYLSRIGLPDGI